MNPGNVDDYSADDIADQLCVLAGGLKHYAVRLQEHSVHTTADMAQEDSDALMELQRRLRQLAERPQFTFVTDFSELFTKCDCPEETPEQEPGQQVVQPEASKR